MAQQARKPQRHVESSQAIDSVESSGRLEKPASGPAKKPRELTMESLREALLKYELKKVFVQFVAAHPEHAGTGADQLKQIPEVKQLLADKSREVHDHCKAYWQAIEFKREYMGRMKELDRERSALEEEKAKVAAKPKVQGDMAELQKQWSLLNSERKAFQLETEKIGNIEKHLQEIEKAYADIEAKRGELAEQEQWVHGRLEELQVEQEKVRALARDVVALLDAQTAALAGACRQAVTDAAQALAGFQGHVTEARKGIAGKLEEARKHLGEEEAAPEEQKDPEDGTEA
jgi:DNA repair exonuclease SbcCD ATPase subunit